MLDLESVPGGVLPGNAVADIGASGRLELAEPIRAGGIQGRRHDEACDQLCLVIRDLPHAAFRRLEQAGHEEIVELAMEGVDEELGAALLVQNEALIHEREARPEPRGVDEEVDLFAAPVDEMHGLAVEPL